MERTAGGITYTLTRRRVRNINLRVRADGSVAASASPRVPAAYVDAFVTARADWVHTAQARAAARREREAAKGRGAGLYAGAVPGILSAIRSDLPGRRDAQNCGARHEHPLGVVQSAHRHAGVCAAALHDAAARAGVRCCA